MKLNYNLVTYTTVNSRNVKNEAVKELENESNMKNYLGVRMFHRK